MIPELTAEQKWPANARDGRFLRISGANPFISPNLFNNN